jgi:rare lipoprotein A
MVETTSLYCSAAERGRDPRERWGALQQFESRQQHAYLAAAIGVMLVTALAYLQFAPEQTSVSDEDVALGAPIVSGAAVDVAGADVTAAGSSFTTVTTIGRPTGDAHDIAPAGSSGPVPVPVVLVSSTTTTTLRGTALVGQGSTTTVTRRASTSFSTTTTRPDIRAVTPVPVPVLAVERHRESEPPPDVPKSTMIQAPPITIFGTPPDLTTSSTILRFSNSDSGVASWYGAPRGTCAHRSVAFGTVMKVTRQDTGATVSCRVADRGPYVPGRVVDLSRDTYAKIADTDSGVVPVMVQW